MTLLDMAAALPLSAASNTAGTSARSNGESHKQLKQSTHTTNLAINSYECITINKHSQSKH